jgi:hypothetical protein
MPFSHKNTDPLKEEIRSELPRILYFSVRGKEAQLSSETLSALFFFASAEQSRQYMHGPREKKGFGVSCRGHAVN